MQTSMVTEGKILGVRKRTSVNREAFVASTFVLSPRQCCLATNALAESWSSDEGSESVMRLINSQWHLLGALPESSEDWKSLDRAWIIP